MEYTLDMCIKDIKEEIKDWQEKDYPEFMLDQSIEDHINNYFYPYFEKLNDLEDQAYELTEQKDYLESEVDDLNGQLEDLESELEEAKSNEG